jgi:DNA invertase Pin-like site-specific DNA recombinase
VIVNQGRQSRVREGDAARTATGRNRQSQVGSPYKGRKPIEAERRNSVLKLAAEGATRAVIATKLGIGEATVYRILAVVLLSKWDFLPFMTGFFP